MDATTQLLDAARIALDKLYEVANRNPSYNTLPARKALEDAMRACDRERAHHLHGLVMDDNCPDCLAETGIREPLVD